MTTTNAPRVLLLAALIATTAAHLAAAAGEPEPEEEAIEHAIILGVGGAVEFELGDRSFHPGANVFAEYEAIENWLEFELGASMLSAEGGVEMPIDLLLKKPFRLTRNVEFMVGLGLEIVRVSGTKKNGTFGGTEFALDLMFWPLSRVGLWVEPSCDVVFRRGTSRAMGSTGGVIFGW
jgi:hypothetical protein